MRLWTWYFRDMFTAGDRELETISVEIIKLRAFALLLSFLACRKKWKEVFVGSTRLSAVHGL